MDAGGGGRFEIPAPPGEQVALVAITRDRVPLVVSVPDVHGGDIELALSPGLWLEGSVRSEGGRVVGGAEVRVVAADALVLDGLGLAGYPVSLLDAKLKVALGDGRALEVPPSARPAWATLGDGTFRIGGLEPGRYFLEATMLGFVPAFESHVGIREDHDNNYDVELFEAFHVAGLVVDGDGVPVAGAEVRADWVVPAPEPDWDLGVPDDPPPRRCSNRRRRVVPVGASRCGAASNDQSGIARVRIEQANVHQGTLRWPCHRGRPARGSRSRGGRRHW